MFFVYFFFFAYCVTIDPKYLDMIRRNEFVMKKKTERTNERKQMVPKCKIFVYFVLLIFNSFFSVCLFAPISSLSHYYHGPWNSGRLKKKKSIVKLVLMVVYKLIIEFLMNYHYIYIVITFPKQQSN